jgi:glycosylphosphatidylinositol transamidase (GPIT) subunit GPI8
MGINAFYSLMERIITLFFLNSKNIEKEIQKSKYALFQPKIQHTNLWRDAKCFCID